MTTYLSLGSKVALTRKSAVARFFGGFLGAASLLTILLPGSTSNAQVNVLTSHNDASRTGQNLNETILTTSNVNPTQFGQLFQQRVNGYVSAQPLYVSQVAIPGKGMHNVVYAVTMGDYVYAFDGDSNGGVDATPLWSVALLTNNPSSGTLQTNFGVTGTPVIDIPSKTMYLVSSEMQGSNYLFRLHALDITTGAEKLGGPIQIQGSVPGTGNGSVGGTVTFDPTYQYQRPGLLLQNGVLYTAIGSIADNGPYHGWIFSYNAANLKQIDIYNTAPNGSGVGIWMAGAGLPGEVNNPNKPYGRMFYVTGNGTFSGSAPYTNAMSYGMSVVDLDLTGGKMTVEDEFTPHNEAVLDNQDGDVGSGGMVLLPTQTLASGATLSSLVQLGKSGAIYVLNRNNLGGFNSSADKIVQELQTPTSGEQNWGAGVWGSVAYWNNHIYSGGTNPGVTNSLTAYSFVNGKMSTSPVSQSSEQFGSPSPTPSISANGNTNGIVWIIDTNGVYVDQPAALLAYDATNLSSLLYSTNSNLTRDDPGGAIKYTVPTIANGKVYMGTINRVSFYGLLGTVPTAVAPTFNPPSETFSGSQAITISDATKGAQIFYTTDGSTPTASSKLYTGPITVSANETLTAIASATGYLLSASTSAVYSSTANAANPVFSLAAGTYTGTQTVTISDHSSNAKVYYTVDGTTPTTSSALYTGPMSVPVTENIEAFATAPGLLASSMVTESYVIAPIYNISFMQGFTDAVGPMTFNGSTDLDDIRLQLTNGGLFEAGSGFFNNKVNVQAFTTDFTFQQSNPAGDGMTFTIQSGGPTALGGYGSALGYGGIAKSVAIKFDIYNNSGEGPNSTGLYIDGASPTVPSIDLTGTGIDLRSGDQIDAHITYDGTVLTMTLTNVVSLASWSHSFTVNIPAVVGSPEAYVGFTGGSGTQSSSQKVTYWTYIAGPPSVPNYPVGLDAKQLWMNGSALSGTSLLMINNQRNKASSAYFTTPVNVESFTSDFDFQLTDAAANGFTFVLQNQGLTATGLSGEGLGYVNIPNSVAIKFDFYNSAGQGNDTTGVFVNGALPTVPAINLAGSKLELNSGDEMHVHVAYDGTTLTWLIQDLDIFFPSHVSSLQSMKINIPHTIGSNTAYAGFTAGTGGQTSIQNILDWTFTNQ